jgi:hypothetical protein
VDWLLSILFPVILPKIELELPAPVRHSSDAYATPLVEDGVLWRGYDVKRTGIERISQEGL